MRQARKSRMKYWPQYLLNTIASMVNGTTPSSREIREIDQGISAQFLSALWADSSHLCARRFPNGVLTPPGLPVRAVSGPLSHPRPLQRLGGFLGMDHTAHA